MRRKKSYLYPVMLITGVAITILSLLGIAAASGFFS